MSKKYQNANTKTDTINWGTGRRVHSIWFDNDKKLYACGGGVFFSSAPNNDWVEQTDVPLFLPKEYGVKERTICLQLGTMVFLLISTERVGKHIPKPRQQ
ncbi:MAG: hypothetical protein MZV64_61430 [Ignavibacteriales bacterium]|nr:hypothetical protein [Ignavibacteriales bacterium]